MLLLLLWLSLFMRLILHSFWIEDSFTFYLTLLLHINMTNTLSTTTKVIKVTLLRRNTFNFNLSLVLPVAV